MSKYIDSARPFAIILLCCVIGIIVMLLTMVIEFKRTADFTAVAGEITSITTEVDYGIENNSKSSLIKYVHSTYEVEGKIYQTKNRTFFTTNKQVGDEVVIKYAPLDPTNTRNEFLIEGAICAMAFLGVFVVFSTSMLIKQKKR